MSGNGPMVPCSVPGCDKLVSAARVTGVCVSHLHHRRHCACDRCVERRGETHRTREADAPPGIRWARVKVVTPTSVEIGETRISLPREPWL